MCVGPGGDVANADPDKACVPEALRGGSTNGGPEKLAGLLILRLCSLNCTPLLTAPLIPWDTVDATPATPFNVLEINSLPLLSPLYGAHVCSQAWALVAAVSKASDEADEADRVR